MDLSDTSNLGRLVPVKTTQLKQIPQPFVPSTPLNPKTPNPKPQCPSQKPNPKLQSAKGRAAGPIGAELVFLHPPREFRLRL